MTVYTFLGAWAVAVSLAIAGSLSVSAQQPQPQQISPAERAAQLQQALAATMADLGACNAKLGPLQQLQAQLMAGQLVAASQVKTEVEKAIAKLKADIENANGKTIGPDYKLTDVAP